MTGWILVAMASHLAMPQARELEVHLVGNAGVALSDGATTLLVDLPYEPGAFGYERYEPDDLAPPGAVVSVITHDHRDHFAAGLFLAREGWRIVGPPAVVDILPPERVLPGDSVAVGDFSVMAIATPHSDGHRSYRIRWRGRVLYFTGDTEEVASLSVGPEPDLLFVTPWLACALAESDSPPPARRSIVIHAQPDGSDGVCGPAERLPQGTRFRLPAAG